ncbi:MULTISPECIES: class I SAM-dependent methyltransferase [Bacillaceae]|jgi:16S rRNA C1402 N4-methylase RsmH|uniref:16S rRNA (Cytosine(1402)-N(4))-methyltransferase n=1 Tax=Gottfriedia luciferensis TaxID=178774 RepID=A0ABX2ZML1_9BACI|nr:MULTISPECIES: class I SAM-dependent methyltransferase [Bacillaceae]ODG90868.1 16S rRNA (cytosine(1402)-N(4))-methyltransferase [Gottfriedia luciferensis]PGZ90712.1 16S rRNA (cytosine(1402)-N(4))-methyltransferase [Bacillus sp. AFS029533]SFD30596.1 Putative rRNA methylase [Bacillus sp. UNCCL81]
MILDRILPYARKLLQSTVKEGDITIDATIGNGHDTVFLAKLVGETGHVYGFDIQELAIQKTTERINNENLSNQVTLLQTSHAEVKKAIPASLHEKLKGAIFNLGYLPGSDKSVVTVPESTISSIEQILEMMAPEGIIVVVIYHGHEGGEIEKDALMNFAQNIPQDLAHVLTYRFINQANNPPFILAIEKRA